MPTDSLRPDCNFRIQTFKKGRLQEEHQSHNIITNVGRAWLRDLVGAANYSETDPGNGYIEGTSNVLSSERIRYMAFGVGGAFSSDPYYHIQEELVTVTALEDYVQITDGSYLKQVLPQGATGEPLPTNYSIKFVCNIPESEISSEGNVSKSSALTLPPTSVGTAVPITEAGLYLSGANPNQNLDHVENTSRLAAYNIFSPITISPNIVIRVEWEFRF